MKQIRNFISPDEFTGWHMVAIMCLFFGTIVSVNMVLAYKANTTWTGLVVKNSYVASQHFQAESESRRRQLVLGWQAQTTYNNGEFSVGLLDKAGSPVSNVQTEVRLGRPAHENDDVKLILKEAGKGQYSGRAELGSGIWQADITVAKPTGDVWKRSIRFVVKGS